MKKLDQNKIEMVTSYWEKLVDALSETHEVVRSCNNDMSQYLIPKGTADQLSYYGKPKNSYRISDHWNWFSSITKCSNPHYIQCYNKNLPWAKRRPKEGAASKPIMAICVAHYGDDDAYHTVYGESFDRKTKEWTFVEE